jgi:hypothetical protein
LNRMMNHKEHEGNHKEHKGKENDKLSLFRRLGKTT